MQNYVEISENSVKNLEILLGFCKLVDLGSLMECLAVSLKSSLASGRSFLLPGGDLVLLLPLLLLWGLVGAILGCSCWRAVDTGC